MYAFRIDYRRHFLCFLNPKQNVENIFSTTRFVCLVWHLAPTHLLASPAPTTDLAATGLVAGASIFGVGLRVSQPLQQSVFSVVVAYAWLPKAR